MLQLLTQLTTYLQARFGDDETGATAVEYALIIGVIGVAVATAALALSGAITGAFDTVTNAIGGGGN